MWCNELIAERECMLQKHSHDRLCKQVKSNESSASVTDSDLSTLRYSDLSTLRYSDLSTLRYSDLSTLRYSDLSTLQYFRCQNLGSKLLLLIFWCSLAAYQLDLLIWTRVYQNPSCRAGGGAGGWEIRAMTYEFGKTECTKFLAWQVDRYGQITKLMNNKNKVESARSKQR